MMCIQYPRPIFDQIVRILDKRDDETLEFDQFASGIKMILVFDTFFEDMEAIFKHLQKSGKIRVRDLLEALDKLARMDEEASVPTPAEISEAIEDMDVTPKVEGSLDYDEFLLVLFQTVASKMEDSDSE